MSVRPRRVAAALTTLALGAGLVAAATQASAASTPPPWEPDASSVGTLTFYDSTGAVITKGSTSTGPFAAYAVGSKAIRSGDVSARLEFANPVKNTDSAGKLHPELWYRQDGGISTYPNSSAPAAVTAAATASGGPTWSGSTASPSLDSITAGFKTSTDAGYTNYVQVRLVTANSAGAFTQQYGVADILINPTAHTWTEAYPTDATGGGGTTNPGGSDATAIAIAATSHVTFGQAATVKALLSDSTTKTGIANQSLTLQQRFSATGAWSNAGTATTTSSGSAAVNVVPGTLRQYRWVFAGTTSGTPTYAASTSGTATTTVGQFVSGYVTSASIKSGANVKFYGAVSPAVKGEKIYLQQLSGKSWVTVPGVVGAIANQKLPNGKTGYGYVLSLNPKTKTTYTFRAFAPSDANNTFGVSVAHLVKVS